MEEKAMAFSDFCHTVRESWTFDKMPKHTQAGCMAALQWVQNSGALKGTYNQRWRTLLLAYTSFLTGLGYDPFGWEKDPDTPLYDKRYVRS